MEILFISHKYPPTIGGMEKHAFELISHVAKDHTVHKIVHDNSKESKFSFFRKLKNRIKKILQNHPTIEVIYLNDGLIGLFTLWLKSYTKTPVVITFHGLDLVFPNRIYQSYIQNKYTRYDAAICVSTATAEVCIEKKFVPEKVFVVPNGVDHSIAAFKPDPEKFKSQFKKQFGIDLSGKKIITMLGRPVQRKGFSWFLREVLPHLDTDIFVLMIGPVKGKKKQSFWSALLPKKLASQIELAKGGMSDEANIDILLQDPSIKNSVFQTGKLPFNQVLEALSLAQLFIMPNVKKRGDAEGFGLVALEASLCKTVVLASELEGITEAIKNDKNGYLIPSEQPKIWIDKIHELIRKPKDLAKRGEVFQQYTLDNFSWQKMAEGYVEVFRKVIEGLKD